MKTKLIKKLILLRMLENNISGNFYGHKENELKKIKSKIAKCRNIKILNQTAQVDIKEKPKLAKSIEHKQNKNDKKDLLIIYIDKKYLNKGTSEMVKKWCDSIRILNYKIIDNVNTLNSELNRQPKAILSCEEVEFFLNQNLRIQVVRGFELRFKEIPLVFTYLPMNQIKNPKLKKEIWQDLKIIKGIIKYG